MHVRVPERPHGCLPEAVPVTPEQERVLVDRARAETSSDRNMLILGVILLAILFFAIAY